MKKSKNTEDPLEQAPGLSWPWLAFFAAALLIGVILRFTWNSDMEFKGDEAWMFRQALTVGRVAPWPALGMPSGAGLRNPGMSVWVFVALARLFGAATPLELDRSVVTLNSLALLALAAFIWRCVPKQDREAWLWAAAFAALSPSGLLLQRKIWAQSVLPLFCVLTLWAWWRRDRWWGALTWGLLGALLGQIHMSGFFFSASFALATAALQRVPAPARKRTLWGYWVAGSALGSFSLLPWLSYVASGVDRGPGWSWETVRQLSFFRFWAFDLSGQGLDYNLGASYDGFLSFPEVIAGVRPVLALLWLSLAFLVAIAIWVLRDAWSRRSEARSWLARLEQPSDSMVAALAGLVLFGTLMTLAGFQVFRHYLIVTYPLEFLPVALLLLRCASRPRWLLLGLCLAHLGLSVGFLGFIHQNGGARGDYGRAYRGT